MRVTGSTGKETFNFINLLGEVEQGEEVLYLSWFTSNGEIKSSQVYVDETVNLEMDNTLPSEAVIVVVLRDGRGGVDTEIIYLN